MVSGAMEQTAPTSSPDFSLVQERLDRTRVIVGVHGAVDLFAAPELKRHLLDAIDSGTREIVLDLSDTAFLDSTGLGALLTAHKRLSGRDGTLIIVDGPPTVTRVFEITGLDSIFSFAATRDAALARLSHDPA
jgi:anti-sigma B factor antagonist